MRPAVIIASYTEPYQGWIDSLAASGAFTMAMCAGVIRNLIGNKENRGDLIPVDLVSNAIIAGTYYCANKDNFTVLHSGSSHINPVTWYYYACKCLKYAETQPMEQNFMKPKIILTDKKTFKRSVYFKNILPA